MAKGNVTGISCIEEHIRMNYKRTKPETYNKYRAVLLQINSILKENGYDTNPRRYDEETIEFLVNHWNSLGLEVSTKNWYTHILNRYLTYFKNPIVKEMELDFGQDLRPKVNWLTEEQRDELINTPKTPLEDVVIHLELCMGLRIVEVCRLRLADIHFDSDPRRCYISVRGKGKGDGKWRNIPFHPDSDRVFRRWIEERNEIVSKMHAYDPAWVVPEAFLLWCHYDNTPDAGAYSPRGHSIDRMVIHKIRSRLGFEFSNHTLRRTFGRTLYRAGVPIETISKLYGHEDTVTTIRYLGIDLDDMGSALSRMYEYQYKMKRD